MITQKYSHAPAIKYRLGQLLSAQQQELTNKLVHCLKISLEFFWPLL